MKKHAAIVRFIDTPNNYANGKEELTNGKYYNALFLEYMGIKRNNLWIINDLGKAEYFYNFDDFEVIKDEDEILRNKYAMVKCIKDHNGLTVGKNYHAIGKNNTDYLIFDDWFDSTLYEKNLFIVISDEHNILSNDEIVYDFDNIILNDLSEYITEPVEVVCHCHRKKHKYD